MAIVKMRKLNLVSMSYDKDAILDALQRTGAAEVAPISEIENTVDLTVDAEELRGYFASVETALESLCGVVDTVQKETGEKTSLLRDGFDVSYSEFITSKDRKQEMDALVEKINGLIDEKNVLKADFSKVSRLREQAEILKGINTPFQDFSDTLHTKSRLGCIAATQKDGLLATLQTQDLVACSVLNTDTENVLLHVVSHKTIATEIDGILSAFGFTDCPYKGEETGVQIYQDLQCQENDFKKQIFENESTMYALKDEIRLLKVYCDYLAFLLEKEETSGKLRGTDRTFILQAYVPEEAEETVKSEIQSVAQVAYMEFSDPTEEDEPPTLLRNNGIVSNFESITNTYSTPNYREFDPNAVMSFFYSLFMGFIIGDAGYGLLMALVGGWLCLKNRARPTGMSRLAGAFAVGGVFAVMWGILFNSIFGLAPLPTTIMPNPQTDMWSLAGISVPSVLIISMEIGVFQLCVGYICKAVQEWRRGNIADGICDGLIWTLFSIGVGLAIVGFVDEANISLLATIGGIMAGGSLLLAMLTAGRKEKFFGKFTKGFGAAYGVINYASDILSYARLYGLMLSGAVIAQIIATYTTQFFQSGQILLIVLAVVLLIVGHGFNLVMNLLGAYIHDARLQYVEFYGRFYEGEGELFKPLGSQHKYIYLIPEK